MIKLCACGKRETVQPYAEAREILGPCTSCRGKRMRIVEAVTVKTTVSLTREEARSFLSKVKFR